MEDTHEYNSLPVVTYAAQHHLFVVAMSCSALIAVEYCWVNLCEGREISIRSVSARRSAGEFLGARRFHEKYNQVLQITNELEESTTNGVLGREHPSTVVSVRLYHDVVKSLILREAGRKA